MWWSRLWRRWSSTLVSAVVLAVVVLVAVLVRSWPDEPPETRTMTTATASVASTDTDACKVPSWPRLLSGASLEKLARDEAACRRLVEDRLRLLEAYVAARQAGCAVPSYPARAQRHLVEVARCVSALPVGDAYDRAYRRVVALAPQLTEEGPTRCTRLALLQALRQWIPDAVAPALANVRAPVPVGRCGAGQHGVYDVPQGFAAWVAEGARRAPAIAAVRSRGAPAPVPVERGRGRPTDQLAVSVTINGKPVHVDVDTGTSAFLALDPQTAERLGIAGFDSGQRATACMSCPPTPLWFGFVDRLDIGQYEVRNVPVDVTGGARTVRLVGTPLLWTLGGLTVGGGEKGELAVVFGPHTQCDHRMDAVFGAQGRLFARADLGPWGKQLLMLDTGLGTDYALWAHVVGQVPSTWKAEARGEHQTRYHAPSMRGQGRAGIGVRHVQVYEAGGPHPVFPGSGGWVGHAAFAPFPICMRPTQPMFSVGQ